MSRELSMMYVGNSPVLWALIFGRFHELKFCQGRSVVEDRYNVLEVLAFTYIIRGGGTH